MFGKVKFSVYSTWSVVTEHNLRCTYLPIANTTAILINKIADLSLGYNLRTYNVLE